MRFPWFTGDLVIWSPRFYNWQYGAALYQLWQGFLEQGYPKCMPVHSLAGCSVTRERPSILQKRSFCYLVVFESKITFSLVSGCQTTPFLIMPSNSHIYERNNTRFSCYSSHFLWGYLHPETLFHCSDFWAVRWRTLPHAKPPGHTWAVWEKGVYLCWCHITLDSGDLALNWPFWCSVSGTWS